MTQKRIANWTVVHESWSDWRRTGFPKLEAGPFAREEVIPIRFRYGTGALNGENREGCY